MRGEGGRRTTSANLTNECRLRVFSPTFSTHRDDDRMSRASLDTKLVLLVCFELV